MDDQQERLSELLADWEFARSSGQPVPPESLCKDDPQLLSKLKSAIQLLKRTEWMTESSHADELPQGNDGNDSIEGTRSEKESNSGSIESSADDIIRRIQQFKLLPESESQKLHLLKTDSAEELTGTLVQQGKLTIYQKKSLLGVNHFPLVIDRYTIIDFLGAGGMGIVFKARHQEMNRIVAIKTIAPLIGDEGNRLQRFLTEIKSLGNLSHPNIVSAYDALNWNDQLYLVMEYADGDNLGNVIRNRGRLSTDEALSIVGQIASAIQFAHFHGIIHRDIKPENIVVAKDGTAKLLDLGLAKVNSAEELTKSSAVVGTPNFVAPELLDDESQFTEGVDIYALGCTLYYLLVGKPPFLRESPLKTLLAHQRDPIPKLPTDIEGREKFEGLLRSMMAKTAKDRPTSEQLSEQLNQTGLIKSKISICRETQLPREFARIEAKNPSSQSGLKVWIGVVGMVLVAVMIGLAILLSDKGDKFVPSEDEPYDLKIAKWVLSYDECTVEIKTEVGIQTTESLDHLPKGDFSITGIQLIGQTDPPDFAAFSKLDGLNWLSMTNYLENEVDFSELGKLSGLKKVYLDNCDLDEKAITAIQAMSRLELLDLSYSEIPFEAFTGSGLSGHTQLKTVFLSRTGLNDSKLESLHLPKSVESLDVQDNQLTAQAIPILQKNTELKILAIGGNQFGDSVRTLIPHLPDLEDLQLDQMKISVKTIESLTQSSNLRILQIYDVGANDQWLDAIVRLQGLEELDIADNHFSDAEIVRLAELKKLRSLTVGSDDSISEDAIEKMRKLMPQCEFYE